MVNLPRAIISLVTRSCIAMKATEEVNIIRTTPCSESFHAYRFLTNLKLEPLVSGKQHVEYSNARELDLAPDVLGCMFPTPQDEGRRTD